MNILEARNVKIGDFVKIINTHKEKKTPNDECLWVVVGIYEVSNRFRSPIMKFDLRLVSGSYKCWKTNQIIEKGGIVDRTNRALKLVDVVVKES